MLSDFWKPLDLHQFFDPQIPHQIFSYETKVSETDLDVFGHVNNANYLRYFERARWSFINERGYGLKKIQDEKKGPVLLEVNLQFRRELKAQDHILILSQSQKLDAKFMTLKQVIIREDFKLSAEAKFLIGFFDLESRKLITPNPIWLDAVGYIS
jgi:thioesterase-3